MHAYHKCIRTHTHILLDSIIAHTGKTESEREVVWYTLTICITNTHAIINRFTHMAVQWMNEKARWVEKEERYHIYATKYMYT